MTAQKIHLHHIHQRTKIKLPIHGPLPRPAAPKGRRLFWGFLEQTCQSSVDQKEADGWMESSRDHPLGRGAQRLKNASDLLK